jgi:hypothetical protein
MVEVILTVALLLTESVVPAIDSPVPTVISEYGEPEPEEPEPRSTEFAPAFAILASVTAPLFIFDVVTELDANEVSARERFVMPSAIVPEVVIGEPERTESPFVPESATDVTVPEPPPPPSVPVKSVSITSPEATNVIDALPFVNFGNVIYVCPKSGAEKRKRKNNIFFII